MYFGTDPPWASIRGKFQVLSPSMAMSCTPRCRGLQHTAKKLFSKTAKRMCHICDMLNLPKARRHMTRRLRIISKGFLLNNFLLVEKNRDTGCQRCPKGPDLLLYNGVMNICPLYVLPGRWMTINRMYIDIDRIQRDMGQNEGEVFFLDCSLTDKPAWRQKLDTLEIPRWHGERTRRRLRLCANCLFSTRTFRKPSRQNVSILAGRFTILPARCQS